MKRKQRLENFVFYDTESVTAHLEDMAQKGWALAEIGNLFWTYEKMEPTTRIYGTTFFPDASEMDISPTDTQAEFLAYCQKAGWQYVTQWKNMQIFQTTAENPIPLETDETLRLKITHKAMKKTLLSNHLILGFLFLMMVFFSRESLVLWMLYLLLACYLFGSCFAYSHWHKQSLRAVEAGGNCLPVSKKGRGLANGLHLLAGFMVLWTFFQGGSGKPSAQLAALPLVCVFLALDFLVQKLCKKLGLSKKLADDFLWFLILILPLLFWGILFYL